MVYEYCIDSQPENNLEEKICNAIMDLEETKGKLSFEGAITSKHITLMDILLTGSYQDVKEFEIRSTLLCPIPLISFMWSLKRIVLTGMKLCSFNFSSLPYTCEYVDLSNNSLESMSLVTQTESRINNIKHLDLSNNFLKQINLMTFTRLETLNIAKNDFEFDQHIDAPTVRKLIIDSNLLESFNSTKYMNLTYLSARNNCIENAHFTQNFDFIDLTDNELGNGQLRCKGVVTELILEKNKLSSMPNLYSCTILNVSDNTIHEITDWPMFIGIKELNASNNILTQLTLKKEINLTFVDVRDNFLVNFPTFYAGTSKKITLDIRSNCIKNLITTPSCLSHYKKIIIDCKNYAILDGDLLNQLYVNNPSEGIRNIYYDKFYNGSSNTIVENKSSAIYDTNVSAQINPVTERKKKRFGSRYIPSTNVPTTTSTTKTNSFHTGSHLKRNRHKNHNLRDNLEDINYDLEFANLNKPHISSYAYPYSTTEIVTAKTFNVNVIPLGTPVIF